MLDIDAIATSLGIFIAISDDKLFQDPPPMEDCPICFLPMPFASGIYEFRSIYAPCCGKIICEGCLMAENDGIDRGNLKDWCSLCRVPRPNSDEKMRRLKRRMELNDANAFNVLAGWYCTGSSGLSRDINKAFELWAKAAELGSPMGHYHLVGA